LRIADANRQASLSSYHDHVSAAINLTITTLDPRPSSDPILRFSRYAGSLPNDKDIHVHLPAPPDESVILTGKKLAVIFVSLLVSIRPMICTSAQLALSTVDCLRSKYFGCVLLPAPGEFISQILVQLLLFLELPRFVFP